jgi:hypothetical protein
METSESVYNVLQTIIFHLAIMSAVILPAAFPLVGLGLASTYFLTVSGTPVL